jgi:hypothetical protein
VCCHNIRLQKFADAASRKILTRNAFANPESTNRTSQTATTKADILNLISSDTTAVSNIGIAFIHIVRSFVDLFLGCAYIWLLLGKSFAQTVVLYNYWGIGIRLATGPSGFYGLATLILTLPPAYFITQLEYHIFEKRLKVNDEKINLMQEAVQAISMIKMMAAEQFWYKRIHKVQDQEFKRLVQARLIGAASGFL